MPLRPPAVISINISPGGIPKRPVDAALVGEAGIDGDGHNHEKHRTPLQGLSLLDVEDLERLCEEGFALLPGSTGENLTLRGLDVDGLEVGNRLCFSGGVVIELTKRRKPCYVLDAIDPRLKDCIEGRCGYYARVVAVGTLRPGETVRVERAAVQAAPAAPVAP